MDRWYEPPVSFDELAHLSRRRTSQLTDCSEAQHSDQHFYPASTSKSAGVQPLCAGLYGVW